MGILAIRVIASGKRWVATITLNAGVQKVCSPGAYIQGFHHRSREGNPGPPEARHCIGYCNAQLYRGPCLLKPVNPMMLTKNISQNSQLGLMLDL